MDPSTDHPTPPQTDENTQSANTEHTTDQADNISEISETAQLETVGHYMRELIHKQTADWGELPWDAPPTTTDSETATNTCIDIQTNTSSGDHEPTPPAKRQKVNEASGAETPADTADITDPPASDTNPTLATNQTITEHPPPVHQTPPSSDTEQSNKATRERSPLPSRSPPSPSKTKSRKSNIPVAKKSQVSAKAYRNSSKKQRPKSPKKLY